MATTYELITSQTVASATTPVTFSSIPQTYKDLVLKASLKAGGASATQIDMTINGGTSNMYYADVQAINATLYKTYGNSTMGAVTGTDAVSQVFSPIDLYFSNYSSTVMGKTIRFIYRAEYASTTAYIGDNAVLFNSNTAISSFTINLSGNIQAGSKFYLYGIKNS
jgi:hypothetical protein